MTYLQTNPAVVEFRALWETLNRFHLWEVISQDVLKLTRNKLTCCVNVQNMEGLYLWCSYLFWSMDMSYLLYSIKFTSLLYCAMDQLHNQSEFEGLMILNQWKIKNHVHVVVSIARNVIVFSICWICMLIHCCYLYKNVSHVYSRFWHVHVCITLKEIMFKKRLRKSVGLLFKLNGELPEWCVSLLNLLSVLF